MQKFELTVLGCSSATPTSNRNPSAQFLNIAEHYFLIDCREATQIQLRRFKIKFQKIDHIFISHLHGDHYLGLMGLLSSMHLLGRTNSLTLYCAPELQKIIELQHQYSMTRLKYPIKYRYLNYDKSETLYEDEKLLVETVILKHRIPCCGFIFREKEGMKNLIKEKIEHYKIPQSEYLGIKKGADFIMDNGKKISNTEITTAPDSPRSYAYCSDTCYDESILEKIANVNLLYHEATFMNDKHARAVETYHSTTTQAGTIAKKANVKKLMIGHYSARYKDLEPMLIETKAVFENTILAIEGEKYRIE